MEAGIAVRFQYEWHDNHGQWWPSYGNELWEFTETGLMRRREASINDVRDRSGADSGMIERRERPPDYLRAGPVSSASRLPREAG